MYGCNYIKGSCNGDCFSIRCLLYHELAHNRYPHCQLMSELVCLSGLFVWFVSISLNCVSPNCFNTPEINSWEKLLSLIFGAEFSQEQCDLF